MAALAEARGRRTAPYVHGARVHLQHARRPPAVFVDQLHAKAELDGHAIGIEEIEEDAGRGQMTSGAEDDGNALECGSGDSGLGGLVPHEIVMVAATAKIVALLVSREELQPDEVAIETDRAIQVCNIKRGTAELFIAELRAEIGGQVNRRRPATVASFIS